MSIKFVYTRGKSCYYQRKIPKDLLQHYAATHIKINLKTNDPSLVARKVQALNFQHESLWEAMRKDPSISPPALRESARLLLAKHGLKPQPATNPDPELFGFYELLQGKAIEYAQGDEDAYHEADIEDYLTSTEIEAIKLLNEKPKLLLSDVLEIYLEGHSKKSIQRFTDNTNRIWQSLITMTGDKPFESFSRADANAYVLKSLEAGVKTTTVRRRIATIKAVFNTVIAEKELTRTNPFLRIRIPGLGEDAEERESFTSEQLAKLKELITLKDDDPRWVLGLQADLGCRLGEVVGLAIDDIHINEPVPYVSIKPHPWRSLKTKNSKRNVPLVGMSLWAAQRIIESKAPGQLYAFPRYTDGTTCKTDNASATLNQWMARQGLPKTTHELRHTMRDRLRNVNAPDVVIDAIGGWGQNSIGESYGQGYSLETMKDWLEKIV